MNMYNVSCTVSVVRNQHSTTNINVRFCFFQNNGNCMPPLKNLFKFFDLEFFPLEITRSTKNNRTPLQIYFSDLAAGFSLNALIQLKQTVTQHCSAGQCTRKTKNSVSTTARAVGGCFYFKSNFVFGLFIHTLNCRRTQFKRNEECNCYLIIQHLFFASDFYVGWGISVRNHYLLFHIFEFHSFVL